MGYQPLEKLLPRSGGSIYKLVLVAAKRATEIADGLPKLIDNPSCNKATSIALDEIAAGKVAVKGTGIASSEEARETKKKE